MAVTTTVLEVLEAAYAKSKRNVPGQIATESGELRELVGRAQRGLYSVAARVNPVAFAASTVMPSGAGLTGWDWPEDVEAFLRLEMGGSEVVVVPFDQREAEPGLPSVYYLGSKFFPAGNAGDPDPTANNLTAWYSKRPIIPAALGDTLDPDWKESFNELLVLEVAIYLALKDERGGEVGELKAERDRWLTQYVAHLEHVVPIERRAWGHVRVFNTNTLVPLSNLVAGGSQAV